MSTTVLVVDDAPDIRMLLRVALAARGEFELVGEAATGEEALLLATELCPDAVVLDLGLPDLAGRDLLTRVRRASPTSRIVVFSGGDSDRAWFEQRSAGYVLKGQELNRLLDTVAEVASDQRHDRAAVDLPGDLVAPREARAVVRDLLQRWGFRDLVDEATLIVSELVANAVEHTGSLCAMVVNRTEGSIRIEVRDEAPDARLLHRNPGSVFAERGRGLMIVSALAADWGVDADERSKSVWVQLARPGSRDDRPKYAEA